MPLPRDRKPEPGNESSSPDVLKPFETFGVEFALPNRGVYPSGQAHGECPFCSRPKLYVNVADGRWDCKSCSPKGGNTYTFLRKIWEASGDTPTADYSALTNKLRLLRVDTLREWGVRKCFTTGNWIVPGYNAGGSLNQIYRYIWNSKDKKYRWYPTAGLEGHGLCGVPLFNKSAHNVYLCEGLSDSSSLWEILGITHGSGSGFTRTANRDASLLSDSSVLCLPSVNVWKPAWGSLVAGKEVTILFDNDHPKAVKGSEKPIIPGYDGAKRLAERLVETSEFLPESIHFLSWGESGYDESLPSGYDVRDLLLNGDNDESSDGTTEEGRVQNLYTVFNRITPIPEDWAEGRTGEARKTGRVHVELEECDRWEEVVESCKGVLEWTDGLDRALSCMLATVVSTPVQGDQLWMKILGPPGSGKTELCEALAVCTEYIKSVSTLRGFHSGYQKEGGGDEDVSLIAKLLNKTLVTKDGDTLLSSPNLAQILSEARDIYDRNSRSDYRHGKGRDYIGVNMTWLLCGTDSLRYLDSSELGQRFIDSVIMEKIDLDLERRILRRVARKSSDAVNHESNGKPESQGTPDQVRMKQVVGGYVKYLRENALGLFKKVHMPEWAEEECIDIGLFVAYLRARPSTRQKEEQGRELASRLVSQHVRLAKCLAVVLNKDEVDEEVLRRVRLCGLDTARGVVLNLVKRMYADRNKGGTTSATLSVETQQEEKDCKKLLRFLRAIKVTELHTPEPGKSLVQKARWRLTETIEDLYAKVALKGQRGVKYRSQTVSEDGD